MASSSFNAEARAAALAEMSTGSLDLLIIGGGITGCGLARDAALRGLRVALVEKADFGYGTSSRSTKIIHGGIRYLALGDLAMVKASARERWVLRRIAPHLVHPLEFVYPLYSDEWRLKYRIGFALFDRLAGARGEDRHHMLDAREVARRVPGLRDSLRGGALYPEFVTDDARLTLENVLSAARHGALVANHARASALIERGGVIAGAIVHDELGGEDREVRAAVVVNAAGVWAERVIRLTHRPPEHHLMPSKGIHLLFHHERLPLQSATHVRASDGREGLAVRRGDYVYVGTSDVEYHGPLDHPRADEAAIDDVLRMTADCFRGLGLTADDVIGTWAGVRPLVAEPGKSTRELSRHDEVWVAPDGLISIVGGKLTTYRVMSRHVMGRVFTRLGRDEPADRTGEEPLPGSQTGGRPLQGIAEDIDSRLVAHGVDDATRQRIAWLYGVRAQRLLDYGAEDPTWLEPLGPATAALRGEVRLALDEEMALTLEDVLDRRTALLLFSDDHGMGAVAATTDIMAERLRWDADRRDAEAAHYAELAREHGLR